MSDKLPDSLVSTTLNFIKALKNHYGAEQAMDTWNNLSSALGDDELTMAVFKVMLNGGHYGESVTLIGWNGNNKIHAIKGVREWCDMSLFDAKRAIEAAETGHQTEMAIRSGSLFATETQHWQHMTAALDLVGLTIQ
jgi:ribosomal protein L7/L12